MSSSRDSGLLDFLFDEGAPTTTTTTTTFVAEQLHLSPASFVAPEESAATADTTAASSQPQQKRSAFTQKPSKSSTNKKVRFTPTTVNPATLSDTADDSAADALLSLQHVSDNKITARWAKSSLNDKRWYLGYRRQQLQEFKYIKQQEAEGKKAFFHQTNYEKLSPAARIVREREIQADIDYLEKDLLRIQFSKPR